MNAILFLWALVAPHDLFYDNASYWKHTILMNTSETPGIIPTIAGEHVASNTKFHGLCLHWQASRWLKTATTPTPLVSCQVAARYFAEQIYHPFEAYLQEEFVVLLLDTQHVVRFELTLYRGTINSVALRIAEVFREAIRHNAYAILVGHNHPSGNPAPSLEDVQLTESLVQAGMLLGMPVVDHLIMGAGQWVSVRQYRPALWDEASRLYTTRPSGGVRLASP